MLTIKLNHNDHIDDINKPGIAAGPVAERTADWFTGGHAGCDVGSELDNLTGGKLEGVKVGDEDLGVGRILDQRPHDLPLCWTAVCVEQRDLRLVVPVLGHQVAHKDFIR